MINICCSGNNLYKSFNLVTGIVPTSAIRHVLQGVKLEVREGKVKLTATDLEILVRCNLQVNECIGEGGVVLPAVRLNNILREWAGNEEVVFSVDSGHCVIKSKGGNFKVVCEDVGQYPEVHSIDIKGFVEVDSGIISDMISKVVHAASTVKAKAILCGVYVKVDKEDIAMVTSDGNRLSYVKRKVSNPDNASMEGIVTVKCLTFLQKFVSDCKGVIKLGIGESQINIVSERGEILSQLIDGRYPNYGDVIPKGNDKIVEVKKDELATAVRMASFMTNEGYRIVKFVIKSGKLQLITEVADIGRADLEVSVVYEGPEFEISMSPDYVLDVLKTLDNDVVIMEFGGGEDAVLMKAGHEQLNVIMPIEM
ncbi:MAG TPA: DNA polymerase III subunit beta [Candidatus Brocadiaceae bacterium]